MKKIVIVALAICSFCFCTAHAADYYVATNGNDSNPGTLAQPFKTLARGVSVLRPGDILYVRGGVYAESLMNNIPSGTGEQSRVTIAAYQQEKAVIQPPLGSTRAINFSGHSYITFEGISIDAVYAGYDGIKSEWNSGSNHIKLIRCEVKNAQNQGIIGTFNNSEFLNNAIHDNGRRPGTHGFYIDGDAVTIANNEIYNNFICALRNYGLTNSIIKNNYIHHNGRELISGPAVEAFGTNNVYVGNVFYANGGSSSIRVAPGNGKQTIINNIFALNAFHGIEYEGDSGTDVIANNIFYNNGGTKFGTDFQGAGLYAPGATIANVKNNIFYHNGSYDYYPTQGMAGWSGNTVNVDPQFVDPSRFNFHLKPVSPAIDAGLTFSEAAIDIDGTTRSGTYDRGAYEYRANPAQRNQPPIVDAGVEIWTTQRTVTLQGTATDDGVPGNPLSYQWIAQDTPPQGSSNQGSLIPSFSSPNSLTTQATFPSLGAYFIKLFANDGLMNAAQVTRVFVEPAQQTDGTIRFEAEDMLHDDTFVKSGSFASNGKYIEVINLEEWLAVIRAYFPGVAGDYDLYIGMFDHSGGNAVFDVGIDRGQTEILPLQHVVMNQNLSGTSPSAVNFVKKLIASNVALRPGDQFFIDFRSYRGDGTELAPIDYFEFRYKGILPFQTVLYGDVSGDGRVSAYDAALVGQYVVGLVTFTSEQITRADVSGGGGVSAYDAALIAQKAVGLITKFPVE